MLQRLVFGLFAVICTVAFLSGQVSGAASDNLGPGFNFLEDNDVDRFIDEDGDGEISDGDTFESKGYIQGLFNAVTGGFAYDQNPAPGGVPPGGTEAFTFELVGRFDDPVGTSVNMTGVILNVYDDTPFTGPAATGPDGANHLDVSNPARVISEIDNFGTLSPIASFDLLNHGINVGNFFTADLNSITIASITDLDFQGSFSLVPNSQTAGIPLVPFSSPIGPDGGPAAAGAHIGELVVSGNEDKLAPSGVWDIATDGDYIVKGIPEASSMGIWACALCGLSLIVRRRKEK